MTIEISVHDAYNRLTQENSIVLIDVRTPGEFSSAHAEMAINLPLEQVTPSRVKELCGDRTPAFICKGGGRSKRACEAASPESMSVVGGTDAWLSAGLPALHGRGVISLERQVRIGAGGLVLLGSLGSMWLTPAFVWLSVFVGAGLIFAGITDWCGMALLLSRMPWNSCGSTSTCSVNK